MIDLHIHTNYSDGADTLIDVLKKAQERKLEYISITDHDNCNVYTELSKIDVAQYFDGVIIPGIEIKCGYQGRLIEILGYKINTKKMQEWTNEFYKDKTKPILQQKYFDILYDKCLNANLIMRPKAEVEFDSNKDWASVTIFNEIKKHVENISKLPDDFLQDFNTFSKKYCGNKNGYWFIDKTKDYPTIQEAITAIKECNGLVFLPHLFIYKWSENIEQMIEDILHNYSIDGIECMHSEFNQKQIDYLIDLCNKRGYYVSGGSDYHGVNKPNIEMEVGKGNLQIEKRLIEDWI